MSYVEAKKYYNLPYGWVLHHKDANLKDNDPERYNEWRIEDVVPMSKSDHIALHNRLNGPLTEERKANISAGLNKHYADRIKHCKVCGKKVKSYNKTGYCLECYRKSDEWKEYCRRMGSKGGKGKVSNNASSQ